MLISQGFNPETGDLATLAEHCERTETTDNIYVAKFSDSDEESDTKRKKNRSKFKGCEENGKNVIRKTPHFIALSMVKIIVTSIGSEKSSRKQLKIKTILSIQKSISRRVSKK